VAETSDSVARRRRSDAVTRSMLPDEMITQRDVTSDEMITQRDVTSEEMITQRYSDRE